MTTVHSVLVAGFGAQNFIVKVSGTIRRNVGRVINSIVFVYFFEFAHRRGRVGFGLTTQKTVWLLSDILDGTKSILFRLKLQQRFGWLLGVENDHALIDPVKAKVKLNVIHFDRRY